jgi:hypothetical protein
MAALIFFLIYNSRQLDAEGRAFGFAFALGGDAAAMFFDDRTDDGEAAVFRPASATCFILNSGGGTTDSAIFRRSPWFANNSTGGTLIQQFGATSDIPVPNAFVR